MTAQYMANVAKSRSPLRAIRGGVQQGHRGHGTGARPIEVGGWVVGTPGRGGVPTNDEKNRIRCSLFLPML